MWSGANAGVAHAQGADSLPLDAALTQPVFPYYMPISLSLDGVWVAYTLQAPERITIRNTVDGYSKTGVPGPSLGCTVWITNVETGERIRLSGGDSTSGWAPQWSPDGRRVAFYSDEGGVARLWVWDLVTRAARSVSSARVRPYTGLEVPRWTPDGRGVVTRILPYGSSLNTASSNVSVEGPMGDTSGRAPGSTVVVYRTDDRWRSRPRVIPAATTHAEMYYAGDLALIDVGSGSITTLARGFKPFDYWISPDGRQVAFTSLRGITGGGPTGAQYPLDLVVVRTDSGERPVPRTIVANAFLAQFNNGVAWSPDSRRLIYAIGDSTGSDQYYITRSGDWRPGIIALPDSIRVALSRRTGAEPLYWDSSSRGIYVASDRLLVRIGVDDGGVRIIARPPAGQSMMALLGRNIVRVPWQPDRRSLVVETRNDSSKQVGFARIDVRTGGWRQLHEEERSYGVGLFAPYDISADGHRVVYVSESTSQPPDVWSATADWSVVRRVTNTSPRLAGRRYGTARLVEWRTAAGERVRGALLLPVGYIAGTCYPMVVYPYPLDARSNDLYRFGLTGAGTENMQLLATRGYAVLAPDAPIHVADQMRSLAEVILPGVDHVVAMGIADSSRLGVIGHSWGGYTVLALLAQTPRFRAAVMRGGVGDLPAMYGEMEPSGAAFGQDNLEVWFGATLWDDRPRYIANSPVFLLDRVRTPLLIIHGGAETTVPVHLADEIFVDLRRLGQEVAYARYGGENHSEDVWSAANQRDYTRRVIEWFDDHLKAKARGVSDSVGGQPSP